MIAQGYTFEESELGNIYYPEGTLSFEEDAEVNYRVNAFADFSAVVRTSRARHSAPFADRTEKSERTPCIGSRGKERIRGFSRGP